MFGTGGGEVSTVAELQTALAGYPGAMGTASVDANGNLTFVASGSNDIDGRPVDHRRQVRHERVQRAARPTARCGRRT